MWRCVPNRNDAGRLCRKYGCTPHSSVWEPHSWGRAECCSEPTALHSACPLPLPLQAVPPTAVPAGTHHICKPRSTSTLYVARHQNIIVCSAISLSSALAFTSSASKCCICIYDSSQQSQVTMQPRISKLSDPAIA